MKVVNKVLRVYLTSVWNSYAIIPLMLGVGTTNVSFMLQWFSTIFNVDESHEKLAQSCHNCCNNFAFPANFDESHEKHA